MTRAPGANTRSVLLNPKGGANRVLFASQGETTAYRLKQGTRRETTGRKAPSLQRKPWSWGCQIVKIT